MDGLASGIAVIASTFLALSFVNTGQTTEALILAIFAGALLGFLVYNSNPASIFMGDSGSMFIGFFLASAALVNVSADGREVCFRFLLSPSWFFSFRSSIRPSSPSCENFQAEQLHKEDAITRRTGW